MTIEVEDYREENTSFSVTWCSISLSVVFLYSSIEEFPGVFSIPMMIVWDRGISRYE